MVEYNISDVSMGDLELETYQSVLLVIFEIISFTVGCTCRFLIIWHLLRRAPSRPLNTMMLVDEAVLFFDTGKPYQGISICSKSRETCLLDQCNSREGS